MVFCYINPVSKWGSLNIEYFKLFFLHIAFFSSPETRVSPWPGKQFFNKECGEWGWLLAWCTSFIFMLLKMERIYQMSKLIVIKWNKYWQKTQTCPVTTNDRNNKYFDDIILFNLHGELLELDLLQNTIWQEICVPTSFFIQDHGKPGRSIRDSQKPKANLQKRSAP